MKHKLNPYLSFEGNCKEAFALYEKAFGGKASYLSYGDIESPTPEKYHDLMIHCRLDVGGDHLMGSDNIPEFGGNLNIGNNSSICIYPDTLQECERLMSILGEGGRVIAPLEKQFFGYLGMLVDKFGVQWMITFETKE